MLLLVICDVYGLALLGLQLERFRVSVLLMLSSSSVCGLVGQRSCMVSRLLCVDVCCLQSGLFVCLFNACLVGATFDLW